jgi:hypothetical protein
MRRGVIAAYLVLALPGAAAAQTPIAEGPGADGFPRLVGGPATPAPLLAPDPPRHPFMAPNGKSTLHVDGFQTDVHQVPGPLGRDTVRASTFFAADCASVTFDSKGRIVTVCVSVSSVTLRMLDAGTLATLASFDLPARPPSANPFQNFTGGGYFYLDDRDRAVIPTTQRHIVVMKATDPPGFAQEGDFDVSGTMASSDAIISALPDWSGRIWFASRAGVVGTVDPKTGAIKALDTKEPIGNSFAVDADGSVFIVTDRALYRFEAGADGMPTPVWSEKYDNTGQIKPGQTQAGSGTTPTLIGRDRVAINDNADPLDVVVYQRARTVKGARQTCKVPIFEKGASSTDQSLIGTPDLIVAENNYGYTGPAATEFGKTTAPGLTRIDLHPSGRGCKVAWTSKEHAPTVVPKLSAATGLVYTYTKDPSDSNEDAWYLTALDVRTGKTVFKAFAGEGLGFNNNYAPVTLGLDGSAYVGVLGGLVKLRDTVPVVAPPAPAPKAKLRVTCRGARVTGARVLRVTFTRGRRRAVDGRPPFAVKLRATRALVRVEGGAVLVRRARARRCRI